MRPFQLSALLVSAGILLSGCYLGRDSVDRSQPNRVWSEDHVCNVSSAPMVVETVVSALFLTVTLVGVLGLLGSTGQSHSVEDGMAQSFLAVVLVPIALTGGLLAADASAGKDALTDCAEAQAEWRIIHTIDGQKHPSK
jgi:hypothetical protein